MTEFDKTELEQNKLFVGNLSWDTKWWELKEFFGQFGEVAYASTAYDKEKKRPKGFGFITFLDEESATKAKEAGDKEELILQERTLFVDFARPRPEEGTETE